MRARTVLVLDPVAEATTSLTIDDAYFPNLPHVNSGRLVLNKFMSDPLLGAPPSGWCAGSEA